MYNIFKLIIILNFEINALILDQFFYMKIYRINTVVFTQKLHFSMRIWYHFVEESKTFKIVYEAYMVNYILKEIPERSLLFFFGNSFLEVFFFSQSIIYF